VGFVRNYYGKIYENSPQINVARSIGFKIFELSEFLVKILKVTNFGARLEAKATYHDSCAGLRECKIKNEPRQLLANVQGLELTEMEDVETCCGFGGTFAVKFEPISIAMGEQKVEHALATDAQYLISTELCIWLMCWRMDGKQMQNVKLKMQNDCRPINASLFLHSTFFILNFFSWLTGL
jgi:L-lactate dehydrogenase complex protein LldE